MDLTEINKVHTGKFSFNWFEDEILCGRFAPLLEINLDIAKETINARKQFTGRKSFPLLIETGDVRSIDREARDYFASKEGTANIIAAAIMTTSYVTKIMCNIFLACNKPQIPTKLFTNKSEAKTWLLQFCESQMHGVSFTQPENKNSKEIIYAYNK